MALLECFRGVRPESRLVAAGKIKAAPQIEMLRIPCEHFAQRGEFLRRARADEHDGLLDARLVHEFHHLVKAFRRANPFGMIMHIDGRILGLGDFAFGDLVNGSGAVVLQKEPFRRGLELVRRARRLLGACRPRWYHGSRSGKYHPLSAVHVNSNFRTTAPDFEISRGATLSRALTLRHFRIVYEGRCNQLPTPRDLWHCQSTPRKVTEHPLEDLGN